MVKNMKTDVDRLLLFLTIKKNLPIYFAKIQLFFNFKSSLYMSVFIFSSISQIFKRKFYVLFRHKHVKGDQFRGIGF